MVHVDFASFVRSVVLPRKAVHPDHLRLDGARTGGNWDIAGWFQHQGKTWKVHADTHYHPLELAYRAAEEGRDPFVEEQTKRGKSLVLTADLRVMQRSRHKYLYIYEGQQ